MKPLEVISKTVKVNNTDERIFNFFADLRNISRLVPPDVQDWNATEDTCSFVVKGQKMALKIVDREPFKTIKIQGDDGSPYQFTLWLQLKSLTAYETAVSIVVRAELNMMMRAAVKKPLQQGVDQIVDYMKMLPY
ncbi:MAG: polyketide cyclase [Marinilabiliales bacterium]|nr:MAG: polyketide cyclase [Marinilabiliales bacterium]